MPMILYVISRLKLVYVTNMLQLLQSLDYDTCENEPFINEENSRGYSVSFPMLNTSLTYHITFIIIICLCAKCRHITSSFGVCKTHLIMSALKSVCAPLCNKFSSLPYNLKFDCLYDLNLHVVLTLFVFVYFYSLY